MPSWLCLNGGVGMFHTKACHRVSSRLGNPLEITEDPSRLISRGDLLPKEIHPSFALTESQGMAGVHSTWSTVLTIRTVVGFFWVTGLIHSSRYTRVALLACVGSVSPQLSCKTDTKAPARQTAGKPEDHSWWLSVKKTSFTKVFGQLTCGKTPSMISKILLAITVSNHLLFGAPKYTETWSEVVCQHYIWILKQKKNFVP